MSIASVQRNINFAKKISAGKGIASITEYYLATASATGVTISTTGWTTAVQTISKDKKYLWNYSIITYTDGSKTTLTPVIIGTYGDTGAAGKGVASVTEYYLATASGSGVTTSTTGWTTTIQTITKDKKYLWRYEVTTYTDGSTPTTTTPVIIGAYGEKGDDGGRGATLRGPQAWSDCAEGYAFNAGGSGETWIDVVLYNNQYYVCKVSHAKSSSNYPGSTADVNGGLWQLGDSVDLVASKILLSTYALVENLGVTAIEMKDADGNMMFEAKDGVVQCRTGVFNNINVQTGQIAGFKISGYGLTNEGFNNDAYVVARNDTAKTFAGIGGNVLPSASGVRAVARFENGETNSIGTNYGMTVYAYGARDNVAISLDGGCIAGLAMRNKIVKGSSAIYLSREESNVLAIGTDIVSVYLPVMQTYDDGHVVRIKSLTEKNVRVYLQNCYTWNGTLTRNSKPVIIYNRNSYITGTDYLTIEGICDSMEFVWCRDITVTVSNTTYYGAWVQYKLPRDW